jgi:hypothetical protein
MSRHEKVDESGNKPISKAASDQGNESVFEPIDKLANRKVGKWQSAVQAELRCSRKQKTTGATEKQKKSERELWADLQGGRTEQLSLPSQNVQLVSKLEGRCDVI